MKIRGFFNNANAYQPQVRLAFTMLVSVLLAACSKSTTMAPVVTGTPVIDSQVTALPLASNPVIPAKASATTTAATAASGDQVAVLLPTSGGLADVSSAVRAGFTDAYQQNSASDKPTVVLDNTSGKAATAVYADAVHDGASAVVGPLEKSDVQALADQGVDTFTLALNQVPTMSPPTNFYQFALAPQDEAYALADKAWYQGYSQPLIIAPDTSWGQAAATAFANQWQRDGGKTLAHVTYHLPGDPSTLVKNNIGSQSTNAKTDVIILIANPPQAYQIVPVLHAKASNVPIYATSIIYSGTPNASANQVLNGIQFVDMPVLINNDASTASARASMQLWQQTHPNGLVRLYAFGYDAYQLSTMQSALSQPGFSYQGLTGKLYLDNQQQIHRKPAWGTFSNGLVVPA